MCMVLFKHQRILLTSWRWDSLGLAWKLAHNPTLNTISSVFVIRYNRDPIIPLYSICSTYELVPSRSYFMAVAIRVSICFSPCIMSLLRSSFTYFCWWISVLDDVFLICSPKKQFNSPIILISHHLLYEWQIPLWVLYLLLQK